MIRKLPVTLWVLLFWSLAQFCAGPDASALSEGYRKSLKQQLNFIIAKHPKYVWGGSTDPAHGLDCSGYLFLAAKWAGIPGVTRTTSQRMAMGFGGWIGRDIDFSDADECDLPFWTFKQHRPYGHLGIFLRDRHGMPAVTHASSKRGVVLEDLAGSLLRNLSKVRRLTIGE